MAVGHPLGAVFVVHAAHGFQIQQFAGHAVDGDLAVVDFAQQAALSTAIAQGFPLLAVELAEAAALPDFFTHAGFSVPAGRRDASARLQALPLAIRRQVATTEASPVWSSITTPML